MFSCWGEGRIVDGKMTAIIEFPRFVRRRRRTEERGNVERQSISVSFERYGRGGVERAGTERVERGVCVACGVVDRREVEG